MLNSINMTKRREFIKKSMIGTAGIAIGGMGFSASSYASIIGANERVNLAVIGLRSRGIDHINNWCALKDIRNVRIMTLCDADEQFFAERTKTVMDKSGVKPGTEFDMRKVFANPEIHAVSIATPNHWHALATIWACQAGKHVYVEKPCSHNIFEGRKMIEAARKYNVRVQVGFQNRSGKNLNDAMRFLHEGGIGDMEEQQSGRIIVHADPDLADLIPGYLANRKMDIAAIREALDKNDLDTVRIHGHSMKGSGGGYGFQTITDIGKMLEKNAQEGLNDGIRVQIEGLEEYLRQIEVVYD